MFVIDNEASPTSDACVTHLISVELTNVAGTLCRPKRTRKFGENAKPEPFSVNVVPPDDGPIVGVTDASKASSTKSNATPFAV